MCCGISSKDVSKLKKLLKALNQLQTRTQTNTLKNGDKLKAMTKYLDRCEITLERLDELSVIHVTGTHGKGSTCLYTENILQKHGYKTGFYSSPHVLEVRERIRIAGRPISKNEFARYFWKIYEMLDNRKENEGDMPLYFPFLTVLAFYVFLENKVDVAIVEVGIGGEYDCTNVVRNTVAVGITPINVDHTAILGATVESIAWHKGGIIKEDCVAFSVEQQEEALQVLIERGKERKCPLVIVQQYPLADDTDSKIPISVKRTNASLAIRISQAFIAKMVVEGREKKEFSADVAIRAVESAFWPGRYQIKQVKEIRFFLDGAHTLQSLKTCAAWFTNKTKGSDKKKVLIFNLTGKRDAAVFLRELLQCQFDVAIFIPNVGCERNAADTTDFKLTADTQLSLCEEYRQIWLDLQTKSFSKESKTFVFSSFVQAMEVLDDGSEYDALVTGSLYLVGAALSVLDPTLDGILD